MHSENLYMSKAFLIGNKKKNWKGEDNFFLAIRFFS